MIWSEPVNPMWANGRNTVTDDLKLKDEDTLKMENLIFNDRFAVWETFG